MARGSGLVMTLLVGATALTSGPARAQPERQPLRIAIYAPWAGPSSADERHALALAIERGLVDASLGTPTVAGYARLKDFRRAITSGTVDLALVDSGTAIALGKRLSIRASWSSGETWLLAGKTGTRLRPSKRLALQASDAGASVLLVARLLRGQTSAGYWSAVVGAPVTADARELVLRDKADVVVLPRRFAGGLVELVDLGSFSELVLATAGRAAVADQSVRVVESVVQSKLGGRWRAGGPRFPEPVAPNRLVVAAPGTDTPSFLDLLAPLSSSLPELDIDEMWMERNAR